VFDAKAITPPGEEKPWLEGKQFIVTWLHLLMEKQRSKEHCFPGLMQFGISLQDARPEHNHGLQGHGPSMRTPRVSLGALARHILKVPAPYK